MTFTPKCLIACNNSDMEEDLSIGKSYEILESMDYHFKVINDKGEIDWYSCDRFQTLDEYRLSKINEILK